MFDVALEGSFLSGGDTEEVAKNQAFDTPLLMSVESVKSNFVW